MTARPSTPLGEDLSPFPNADSGIPLETALVDRGVLTASQWAWALYESAETPLTVTEICLAHGWAEPMALYSDMSTQHLGLGDILILTQQLTLEQWQEAIRQVQFDLKSAHTSGIPAWADHLVQHQQLTLPQLHGAITRQAQLHLHPQPNAWEAIASTSQEREPQGGSLAYSLYSSLEDLQPLYWSVQNAQLDKQENSLHLESLTQRNQVLALKVEDLQAQLRHQAALNQQLQEEVEVSQSIEQERTAELQRAMAEATAQLQQLHQAHQTLFKAHSLAQQRIQELESQLEQKERLTDKQQQALRLLKEQMARQAQQQAQALEAQEQQARAQQIQFQEQLLTSRSEEKRLGTERMALQEQTILLEGEIEHLKAWIQQLQEQTSSNLAPSAPDLDQASYQNLRLELKALQSDLAEQEEQRRQMQMGQDLLDMEVEQQRDFIQQLEAALATEREERQKAEQRAQQHIQLYTSQIEQINQDRQREMEKKQDLMREIQRLQQNAVSFPPSSQTALALTSASGLAMMGSPTAVSGSTEGEFAMASLAPSPQSAEPKDGIPDLAEIEMELDLTLSGFDQATPWIKRILAQLFAIDLLKAEAIQMTLVNWEQQGGTFTDVLARSTGLKPETVKFFGDGGFGARLMGARTVEDFLVASGLVTRFQIDQARRTAQEQGSGATVGQTLASMGILSTRTAHFFAQTFGTASGVASATLGSRPQDWGLEE